MTPPAPEPTWQICVAAYLDIGSRTILLLNEPGDDPNTSTYAGEMLPGASPVSIKAFVNRILATFSLQLPETVPDISLDSISATITRQTASGGKTSDKTTANFRFDARSSTFIKNPLTNLVAGLSVPGITGLDGFNVSVASSSESKDTAFFLTTTVCLSEQLQALSPVTGQLVLDSGGYAASFSINQELSIAKLLGDIFNCTFPNELAEFLPTFSPPQGQTITGTVTTANGSATVTGTGTRFLTEVTVNGPLIIAGTSYTVAAVTSDTSLTINPPFAAAPAPIASNVPAICPGVMRLYYSSANIKTTQGGETYLFQTGFNFDQCSVEILGYAFFINLNVIDADNLKVGASFPLIDLGILQIGSPSTTVVFNPGLGGPVVQVLRENGSTTIDLQASLIFFGGADSVTLDLSADYIPATPTSGYVFEGSVTYKGSILGISDPTLSIAWSKADGLQFKNFPIPQGELSSIIDFAKELKDVLNNKPGNTCAQLLDFTFSKTVTTTFKLNVKPTSNGGNPGLAIGGTYSVFIAGFNVCEIVFSPIVATISMPKSFDELGNAIIQTLKDNVTALVQALADNVTELTKFLAAQALQTGGKAAASALLCNVGETAAEAAGDAAAAAAEAAAAGALDTLASAAAVFAAATTAISTLANLIDGLIHCGKSHSSEDQQRDKARARQEAAQKEINALLSISGFSAHYVTDGSNVGAVASWNAFNITENPPPYLVLQLTDATGSVLYTSPFSINTASWNSPADLHLQPGQTYTLTLRGHYAYNNHIFDGLPVSQSVTVDILSINAPAVAYEATANAITATWSPTGGFVTPDAQPVTVSNYTVELWDLISGSVVASMSATVAGNSSQLSHAFSLLPPAPPYFVPTSGNSYQVRLQAIGNLTVFNSLVWKSAPLSVGIGIGHTLIGKSFTVG